MSSNRRGDACLFDRVVDATGIVPMLAPGAVKRCCKRIGVDSKALTPHDVQRLLPHLALALNVYLTPEEASVHMKMLRALALNG